VAIWTFNCAFFQPTCPMQAPKSTIIWMFEYHRLILDTMGWSLEHHNFDVIMVWSLEYHNLNAWIP
jgi:hypothetical protein